MNRSELIQLIENGSDIMFTAKNKHFTIITWHDYGMGIAEQHPKDTETMFYKTTEELVDKFEIEGECLDQIANQVVIDQYS